MQNIKRAWTPSVIDKPKQHQGSSLHSTMKTLLLFMVVIGFATFSTAKRYCQDDTACEDLGDLTCIKSVCKWGTCGCPPGHSPRYVGSWKKFRCVKNKRLGDPCSTHNEEGVCLAPNSFCDMERRKCKCKENFVPAWGGEACISKHDASETCQAPGTSSLTTCNSITSVGCYGVSSALTHSVIPMGASTCPCPNTHTLDWVFAHGSTSYWLAPTCRPNRIGDVCLVHNDCPNSGRRTTNGVYINGGRCDNNRCVCESGLVPNYAKSECKEALSFGETCASSTFLGNKVCNGEKGLTCGDICDVMAWDLPITGTNTRKCTCGPHHTTSGTSCVEVKLGGGCYGDVNCQGIGPLAVCDMGKCVNGGGRLVAGWLLTTLLSMFIYMTSY